MYRISSSSGFSLIELLVSLSLFTVVITMAVGTLLILIDANAKAQNVQEVMTNLTFALDSMTREIRTGRGYYCSNSLPSNINVSSTRDCSQQTGLSVVEGGSSLTGSGNPRIAYRFANGAIERRLGTGSWQALTSDAVTITALYFTVTGSSPYATSANRIQPTVSIVIEGNAGELDNVDTDFTVQTTITRRLLDI